MLKYFFFMNITNKIVKVFLYMEIDTTSEEGQSFCKIDVFKKVHCAYLYVTIDCWIDTIENESN